MNAFERTLRATCGDVKADEPMSLHSWWRIGGPADWFCTVTDEEEIAGVLRLCQAAGMPYVVTGGGANLLWLDMGFRGVVIKIGPRFGRVRFNGTQVAAQAGVWGPALVRRCWQRGLSGFEHLAGVPGCVGGLVYMNAGSLRQGIGDRTLAVTALNGRGDVEVYRRQDAGFTYRRSSFQTNGRIILAARFELEPDDPKAILRRLNEMTADRRAKFPLEYPSCGSVFANSDELYQSFGPIGKVIQDLGLKGSEEGAMQVSPKHANFIVNRGGGTAQQALKLIGRVKRRLKEHTGFDVPCEVRAVTVNGRLMTADKLA